MNWRTLGLLSAMLIWPTLMYSVTLGQVDNFEDGTTQNWVINLLGMGTPPPETFPKNVPTGGPAGLNDNYLLLTSTGSEGAGGRLVAVQYNHQWAGDFITAGISGIRMDVNNFGTTDLFLRLLIANPHDLPPTDEAISTNAIFLPVGSGWRSVFFPIAPGFLTADVGTVTAALSGATEFRIMDVPDLAGGPIRIAASLGVDNITAAAIPEPSSAVFMALGIASLLSLRRK